MNSGDPDQTPHYLTSDLGLRCLPMSHKKTLGLYGLIDIAMKIYSILMHESVRLDPDQTHQFIRHDLYPNCLQSLS